MAVEKHDVTNRHQAGNIRSFFRILLAISAVFFAISFLFGIEHYVNPRFFSGAAGDIVTFSGLLLLLTWLPLIAYAACRRTQASLLIHAVHNGLWFAAMTAAFRFSRPNTHLFDDEPASNFLSWVSAAMLIAFFALAATPALKAFRSQALAWLGMTYGVIALGWLAGYGVARFIA